jgi:hypothetical protein
MVYRLFSYDTDNSFFNVICGFLNADKKKPSQPEEWYRWRFEQNPSGKAIIVYAVDEVRLVACMVVELVSIMCDGKKYLCGYVSNLVVEDGYELSVIVPELIAMAESEAKNQGVDILYAFGCEMDLFKGVEVDWNYGTEIIHYDIQQVKIFPSPFHIPELKNDFIPNTAEAYHPDGIDLNQIGDLSDYCNEVVKPVLTQEFLNWHFSFTDRNYVIVDNDNVVAIAVFGHRGIVKEAHLLMMDSKKDGIHPRQYQKSVVDIIREEVNPDVISCIEEEDLLTMKGIIKESTSLKYGYKALKAGCGEVGKMAVIIRRWM